MKPYPYSCDNEPRDDDGEVYDRPMNLDDLPDDDEAIEQIMRRLHWPKGGEA